MRIRRLFLAFIIGSIGYAPTAHAAAGQLTIAVSQPSAGTTIARGSQRVEMLSLDFSASCDSDIRIQSLGLQHRGMGSVKDIQGVYAFGSARRLTRSTAFDSSTGLTSIRFTSALTVAKCDTVHVDLLADFSPTADSNSEHSIDIVQHMVQSSAVGVSIVQDNTKQAISLSPVSAPMLEISFLGTPKHVTFGRSKTIARLQLRNVSDDDIELKKITLTNEGTVRDYDLRSIQLLTTRNEPVTEPVAHMKASTVTLSLNPYLIINRGDTKVLLLSADVWSSQNKTIDFVIEERGDVILQSAHQR